MNDLKDTSPDMLQEHLRVLGEHEATMKARKAAIMDELSRRFGAGLLASLDEQGKTHGTVRNSVPGSPLVAVGVRSSKVTWDSAKLLDLAFSMPRGEANKVFKIEVSTTEAAYNAATGNFRAALEGARTTKLGDIKVTLELPKEKAA